jgi:quercetin dioxygenase-like cupin family protein
MPTKRGFLIGCAICAVAGLRATDAGAQSAPAATAGVSRRIVSQTEGPTPGYTTLVVEIEIAPDATVARHTHPGMESTYFVEGGGELMIDGQPPRTLKAGEAFQVPTRTVHALRNGSARTRGVATYVVETGQPLATPA